MRALGFAARFVSGYVYDTEGSDGSVGGGNTHAGLHTYLPGSGWVEFDPTNGISGCRGHVRVAFAGDPYQAPPLSGAGGGFPARFLRMTLSVDVRIGTCMNPHVTGARLEGAVDQTPLPDLWNYSRC